MSEGTTASKRVDAVLGKLIEKNMQIARLQEALRAVINGEQLQGMYLHLYLKEGDMD